MKSPCLWRAFRAVSLCCCLVVWSSPAQAQMPDEELESYQAATASVPTPDPVPVSQVDPGAMIPEIMPGGKPIPLAEFLRRDGTPMDNQFWLQVFESFFAGFLKNPSQALFPGASILKAILAASQQAKPPIVPNVAPPATGTRHATGLLTGTGTGGGTGTRHATGLLTGAETGTTTGSTAGTGTAPVSDDEAAFEARFKAEFSGSEWYPTGKTAGGDTNLSNHIPSFGFPQWFCDLQLNLLQRTKTWDAQCDKARKLLEDYATFRAKQLNGGVLHPTLAQFFSRIGYSRQSTPAGAEDLYNNGGDNAGWCYSASARCMYRGLAAAGFKFVSKRTPNPGEGAYYDWGSKLGKYGLFLSSKPAQGFVAAGKVAPGDLLMLKQEITGTDGKPAVRTHYVTVAGVKDGKILMVSGNAGGAKGGTVRIEELDPKLDRKKGFVIESVFRYSQLDPEKLKGLDAETLKSQYGLERAQ